MRIRPLMQSNLHLVTPANATSPTTGSFGRGLLTLLVALTLLLPLLASAPAHVAAEGLAEAEVNDDWLPTTGQSGNPMIYGIASHAWWLDPEVYGDQLLPVLDDLRVTTVRLSIDWRRFEPQQGVFDWGMYDRVLGELAQRNIEVVADFNTIPGWASVDGPGCDDAATEVYFCELREEMRPAFENAIRAALTRYAWIEHWEFWNEPEMWQLLGEDAIVYIGNLRSFYDVAHSVNPEIVVAAQTLVGGEYMHYLYSLSETFYGPDNEPWDAVSFHPYNWQYEETPGERHFELNYDRILGLRQLMVDEGDGDKPMWITEYGWNNGVENQARNLANAWAWMQRQPWIEFAHLHMLHDWNTIPADIFGLLEILPDENGYVFLGPHTQFAPKPEFYNAFRDTPREGARLLPPNTATSRSFPETGFVVEGRFLRAWEARGGLQIVGLPLTRPYARQAVGGRWLLVQDFERARLEYHPEFAAPNDVLGTLIGNQITAERRMAGEAPFVPLPVCPPTDADRVCFVETGHTLSYGFRTYWEQNGGLAMFGFPISEEFSELNPDTGMIHTVQYFERGRFEFHPEFVGTPYAVLLGLLIRDDLQHAGWTWPQEGSRLPTVRLYE